MKRCLLVICTLITSLVIIVLHAGAQPPRDHRADRNLFDQFDSTVERLERAVRSETERLVHAAAAVARAGLGAGRAGREAPLRDAAQRREAAMIALMETAPAVALRNAIPDTERQQLPASVLNYIESAATETGTLEVLGVLGEDGKLGMERYLVAGDRRLRMWVERLSDEYMTGTVMTVRGIVLSGRLAAVNEGVTVHQVVTPDDVKGEGVSVRYALVLNINFSDLSTEPWTIEFVNDLFVNSIGPWYEEGSYSQTSMAADAIGWFTIEAPSTTCATTAFRNQAEAAARTAGYEPDEFDHVIIAFPRVAACRWAGLAQIGGRYSWLNNSMRHSTAVHELGHNLGLGHSRSQRCSDGPLTGECTASEYGDRFDVMGRGGLAHYHASYRAHLGWIPNDNVTTVTPADGEVIVALRSAATPFGTRVLRVQRGQTDEYLHVEVREAVGFDSVLERYPALLNGVAVYLGTSMRNHWIVDVGYTTTTVEDAPLQFGDTLDDLDGDVGITPLYTEDGETYVQVSYGSRSKP